MIDYETSKLRSQLAVLKDVLEVYPTATVDSAIRQISDRLKVLQEQQGKE